MASTSPSIESGGRLEVQVTNTNDNGETPQKGIGSNSEGLPNSITVGDDTLSRQICTAVNLGRKLWRRTKGSGQHFAEIESAVPNLLQVLLRLQVEVTQSDSLFHRSSQCMEELTQLVKGCDLTLVHTESALDPYQDHNLTNEEDLVFVRHGLECLKLTISGYELQGNLLLDNVQSDNSRVVVSQQRHHMRIQNETNEITNRILMEHDEVLFRDGEELWKKVCSELEQEGYPSQFMLEHKIQQSTSQSNSVRSAVDKLPGSSIASSSEMPVADDINDFIDEHNEGRPISLYNGMTYDHTETLQRLGIRYEERPNYVAILGRCTTGNIAELASQSMTDSLFRTTRGYSHHGKQ
ncbi:hypothetical protein FSARC_2871 [Fusarium sarcochroum]|uniref:Uncharacterized protein n=1 Tax=Fusarium sarcochroum TaxID=1208366 RepID=A0A8H4XCG1_9HYPO|nr:hypothetical protein FSARC_2871 [Fusarium sarcochroum]